MYLTDKEIKTIKTSQLKGELRNCIRTSSRILEELSVREQDKK
tara:strand:- start:250 stop:378 length:129 start_codon:yes stop_codon:yes gene_type:complete